MQIPKTQTRHGQRGVVILVLILIVMSASSYIVLKALNENTARGLRQELDRTHVLNEAKQALIGYAASYADGSHSPDKGPGHLPCPDHDAAGTPGSSDTPPLTTDCTSANANETGLFPWRTLGLRELKDGSGAPLWYAVSDNFRATAVPPLNSETPATLTVAGAPSEIVAVIIAPGEALGSQYRTEANRYDAATFLENENASTGDGIFTTAAVGDFNDTVVTITRQELMAVIERSVVTEVALALDNYFLDPDGDDVSGVDSECGIDPDCDDGYPWLAQFDPTLSNPPGMDGTRFGHVPLLIRPGSTWTSNFSASWSIASAGAISYSGSEPPSENCMRQNACTLGDFTFPAEINASPPWTLANCAMNNLAIVSPCTAIIDFTADIGGTIRSLRRTYEFSFTTSVHAPTADTVRTIGARQLQAWTGPTQTIVATDFEMPGATEIGSATLIYTNLPDAGDYVRLAVQFDVEASHDDIVDRGLSPGELPKWFVTNEWHKLVVVRYAVAESPGNAVTACVPGTDCLTLRVSRTGGAPAVSDTSVRGVVIAAGARLDPVNGVRPSSIPSDYFENDNASVDETFGFQPESTTFNDHLVTLPVQRP